MNISTANQYVTPVHSRLDLTGKKVVTIAELMEECSFQDVLNDQYIGKDGKVIDISKLDRIPLEELLKGLYTQEFSPNVENGIRYQRSCFDFTNSWEFAKLTAAEDFTGMSDSEIYPLDLRQILPELCLERLKHFCEVI